jgi:hypothetical protein
MTPTTPTISLERRLYTLPEFHAMGGPAKTRAYSLIRTGALSVVKDGKLTKITAAEVNRFFAAFEQHGRAAS